MVRRFKIGSLGHISITLSEADELFGTRVFRNLLEDVFDNLLSKIGCVFVHDRDQPVEIARLEQPHHFLRRLGIVRLCHDEFVHGELRIQV